MSLKDVTIEQYETEGAFAKRLRETGDMGFSSAQSYARKQAMLRDLANARNSDDPFGVLLNVLTRVVNGI